MTEQQVSVLVALVVVGQVALCKPARIQSGELCNICILDLKYLKIANKIT